MRIVNLFAGPGVGKSTTALGLAHQMKCSGLNVELVTEYAKDMVYENRSNILSDQIYIFAKQQRRLSRLLDHGIDYVITDSPLPTSLLYTPNGYYTTYSTLLMEVFNSYDNYNVLLRRNPEFEYNPVGRVQKDVDAAAKIDKRLNAMLEYLNISHQEFIANDLVVDSIMKDLGLA